MVGWLCLCEAENMLQKIDFFDEKRRFYAQRFRSVVNFGGDAGAASEAENI